MLLDLHDMKIPEIGVAIVQVVDVEILASVFTAFLRCGETFHKYSQRLYSFKPLGILSCVVKQRLSNLNAI